MAIIDVPDRLSLGIISLPNTFYIVKTFQLIFNIKSFGISILHDKTNRDINISFMVSLIVYFMAFIECFFRTIYFRVEIIYYSDGGNIKF